MLFVHSGMFFLICVLILTYFNAALREWSTFPQQTEETLKIVSTFSLIFAKYQYGAQLIMYPVIADNIVRLEEHSIIVEFIEYHH